MGEAADAIRARAKRAGFDEREVFFIERVADWEAVRATSNNLSLFGSRKLIEIRLPSGKPGTGGSNAIVDLLANASPDNVYLMLTGKLEREQNSVRLGEGIRIRGRVAGGVAGGTRPFATMAARTRRHARARHRRRCRAVHRRAHRGQSARRATGAREAQARSQAANASILPRCRPRLATARASTCSSSAKPRSAPTCHARCAFSPACAAKAWSPHSRSGRSRARSATSGAPRSQVPRAAGRSHRPRSKTPSAAQRSCPMRGSRRESRAPIA